MGKVRNKLLRILITLALLFYLSGCGDTYSYYLQGNLEQKQVLRRLFKLLEQQKEEVGENRFILVQQIANRLLGTGEREKAILFLTTYVEQNPKWIIHGRVLWDSKFIRNRCNTSKDWCGGTNCGIPNNSNSLYWIRIHITRTMKVGVVGGRKYDDYDEMKKILDMGSRT